MDLAIAISKVDVVHLIENCDAFPTSCLVDAKVWPISQHAAPPCAVSFTRWYISRHPYHSFLPEKGVYHRVEEYNQRHSLYGRIVGVRPKSRELGCNHREVLGRSFWLGVMQLTLEPIGICSLITTASRPAPRAKKIR